MVKKTTDETSKKVEVAAFDLKLPDGIDVVKPWAVVDMPRNKQVMVYIVPSMREGMARNTYDAYLVSKKSLASATAGNNYARTASFENIPALKHWLYDTAWSLSIKRATRKMVNVVDLQDVDEDDD